MKWSNCLSDHQSVCQFIAILSLKNIKIVTVLALCLVTWGIGHILCHSYNLGHWSHFVTQILLIPSFYNSLNEILHFSVLSHIMPSDRWVTYYSPLQKQMWIESTTLINTVHLQLLSPSHYAVQTNTFWQLVLKPYLKAGCKKHEHWTNTLSACHKKQDRDNLYWL